MILAYSYLVPFLNTLTNYSKCSLDWRGISSQSTHPNARGSLLNWVFGLPPPSYIGASNYQIGVTIKQNDLPIVYFSHKLLPTQRMYSTIEQEMSVIVKVLKEYRNYLLEAQIIILKDHKNLLVNSSTDNWVFRWKQKIEEFVLTLHYVKGPINQEADALSRLPIQESDQGIEVMLNNSQIDPSHPILNKYPLDLVTSE